MLTFEVTIGWTLTTISCVVSILALSMTTYWSLYGLFSKKAKGWFKKISKKLLLVNWSASVSFTIVTVPVAIHSITILLQSLDSSKNINFITDFEAENLQTLLLISIMFYLIGKFLIYFVLLLRLVYLLQDTPFAYDKKSYNMIKFAISAIITFAASMLGFSLLQFEIIANVCCF